MLDKKKHINEAHLRFQRLMRWEILPLVALSLSVIVYFKFKTEILNLLVPAKLLGLEAFSDREEKFIARKLSGLLSQSYSLGKVCMREDLVEYQLVSQLYGTLLKHCHDLGLVPASVKQGELVIYYSDVHKHGENYHSVFILPNGSLFMSEVSLPCKHSYIVLVDFDT